MNKADVKGLPARPRRRCEDNSAIDLVVWTGLMWLRIATKFWLYERGIFFGLVEELLVYQEEIYWMELGFKFFICPTNAYKLYLTIIIIKVAPTCFGLHKPSSGSCSLCLAKITFLFPVYVLFSESRLHICSMYTGNRNVILAKHRLQLPDDGLCKPKHVGATFIILNVLIIV